MAVVTVNFNGVKGRNQYATLAGSVSSLRVEYIGANPNTIGRLGYASFVLSTASLTEFAGGGVWWNGRAWVFTGAVPNLLFFWVQRRVGFLPMRLIYVNNL